MRGIVQRAVSAEVRAGKERAAKLAGVLRKAAEALAKGRHDPKAFARDLAGKVREAAEGRPLPSAVQKQVEALEQRAIVLQRQNTLVDEIRPGIAAAIEKAVVGGGPLDLGGWIDEYTQRTRARWRSDPLARGHPDLLGAVEERIQGIVPVLLKARQASVRDRVESVQKDLAEANRPRFAARVVKDRQAGKVPQRDDYQKDYVAQVQSDWEGCPEFGRSGKAFPRVLPKVETFITGIVGELLPEAAASAAKDDREEEDNGRAEPPVPPAPPPQAGPSGAAPVPVAAPPPGSWLSVVWVVVLLALFVGLAVAAFWCRWQRGGWRKAPDELESVLAQLGDRQAQIRRLRLLADFIRVYGDEAEGLLRHLIMNPVLPRSATLADTTAITARTHFVPDRPRFGGGEGE